MSETPSRGVTATTLLGGGAAVVSLLPLFLTGAMSVQITDELAFGSVGLGLAVAAFRGSGAVTSVHLGRLADHLGATSSIRLASACAAVAAFGIAVGARSLLGLIGWLILCGATVALAQPAANRLLTRGVPIDRLGTAFGIKQSAPPAAALVAGAAVPAVAITIGWRWGYVLAGCLALGVWLWTRPISGGTTRAVTTTRGPRQPLRNPGVISLLALAFALGDATSSVSTTFLVEAQVNAGTSPVVAGAVLSMASLGAVLTRLALGRLADRLRGGHLRICAVLLLVGALGLTLLATRSAAPMAVGALLAFAGTWGFNGVFWYAMVRAYPEAPGRITGALSPGGLAGGMIGPVLFGAIADGPGYATAWRVFALVALAAGGTFALAGERLAIVQRPGNDDGPGGTPETQS